MDAYIYRAALWCPLCAREIKRKLKRLGEAPKNPNDEYSYDSGDYPKGPYPDGGGESDSPEYCHGCQVFLENPLTGDGEDYVREAVLEDREARARGKKANPVVGEWKEFYDYIDYGDEDEDEE